MHGLGPANREKTEDSLALLCGLNMLRPISRILHILLCTIKIMELRCFDTFVADVIFVDISCVALGATSSGVSLVHDCAAWVAG